MGLEGSTDYPYTEVEGTDFALNLAIPDVDFGTLHLYTLLTVRCIPCPLFLSRTNDK